MTETIAAPSVTRDDTWQLPTQERRKLIEKIQIGYPHWVKVLRLIERCHQLQSYAAKPPCLLIAGRARAGKTTLSKKYTDRYPAILTETGKKVPVLYISNPTTGSITDLATAILMALGDPRADRGTLGNKTFRIEQLFAEFGVELLILDELQHFWDRDSDRVLLNASNWLKALIKTTNVAAILVGLEGDAEEVVNTNEQLASLFPDPIYLKPFDWNEQEPNPGDEFRTFLFLLDSKLPLKEWSNLADPDLAWRCFVATEGVIGYIMPLIRCAADLALDEGRERIDACLLEQAFVLELGSQRRGIPNPFIGGPPDRPKALRATARPREET